ncbi:MAG: helix-turn-helix transcriptional regulator [Eubacterium sp.]|nr:helix-turn-helix transcriptional regulator [Eubacterium sp.]
MDRDEIIKSFEGNSENNISTSELIKKLRAHKGMSRKEFCEYLGVPYRTLQDWELGNRSMSDYMLRIMMYAVLLDVLPSRDVNDNKESVKT